MADRTVVLSQNGRHAVRGLSVNNPSEFSAYQDDDDDLTYVVDLSAYLDGDTITVVTRVPQGVFISNSSNTTTRLTQRLRGFGYVDFKVQTSAGDVEEFRINILRRVGSKVVLGASGGGGTGVTPGDYGDISISAGNVWTIDNSAVTNAKVTSTFADGIESSKLRFTQAGSGAVARSVDAKLKEFVSVKDFGAVGDGVADDTTALQDAVNAWLLDNTEKVLTFPPGKYKVTSQILLRPPQNTSRQKALFGYGAEIVNSIVGSDAAFNFTTLNTAPGSTKYFWANAVIEGLTIRGGANPWSFRAGGVANSNWMWQFTLKNINAFDFSGDGVYCYDGFFENAFYSCASWANTNNTTGSCFKFENGPDSVISSIEIHNANTRYGKYGVLTITPVVDVDIFGGTFLEAQEEGIRFESAQGQTISGAHVENNWQAGGGTIRPGIRFSGHCSVVGVTAQTSNSAKQNYAVQVYSAGGGTLIAGGVAGGSHTAFGYYDSDNGANSCITSLGVSFTEVKSVKTLNVTGNGTRASLLTYRSNSVSYAANVTPDLNLGGWFQVGALTGNITVNNPTITGTIQNGTMLTVLLLQDATGGRTVTWGNLFKVGSAIDTTANARSIWTFIYDNTNWREVAFGATDGQVFGSPVVQTDVGSGANQIPLNQYLGSMAYLDADNISFDARGTNVAEQNLAVNKMTTVTISADTTLTTTVPRVGSTAYVTIITSGVTSRTVTFGAGFKSAGTLATGTDADRRFVFEFLSDGTNLIEVSRTAAITY